MESKPYAGLVPAVQPPPDKAARTARTEAAGTSVDKNGKPLKKGFWHRIGRALFG
jgi:hypothetical protein